MLFTSPVVLSWIMFSPEQFIHILVQFTLSAASCAKVLSQNSSSIFPSKSFHFSHGVFVPLIQSSLPSTINFVPSTLTLAEADGSAAVSVSAALSAEASPPFEQAENENSIAAARNAADTFFKFTIIYPPHLLNHTCAGTALYAHFSC